MAPAGDPGRACASLVPPDSAVPHVGLSGASACLSVLLTLVLPWAALTACLSGRRPQPSAASGPLPAKRKGAPPGSGEGASPDQGLSPAQEGTLFQKWMPPADVGHGSSPSLLSWEAATWLLLLVLASETLLSRGSGASTGLLLVLALLFSQAAVAWSCFYFCRLGLPLALAALTVAMLLAASLQLGPFCCTPFSHGALEAQVAVLSLALLALLLLTSHPPEPQASSLARGTPQGPELAALEAQVEQLKAAAATAVGAKVQFLGNMSHELRTPLHGILGMVDLALDDAHLSAEVREQLETVVQLANQLLVVVGDVLDMSKLEAGELSLEEDQFDLRSLVNATMTMLAVRAHVKGLGLTWVLDPHIPPRLWGDSVRLRQCLVNLVGNALKFTHVGQVEVSVRVLRVGEEPPRMTRAPLLSTPPGLQGPLLSSVSAPSPKSRRPAPQAGGPTKPLVHPSEPRPNSPLVRQGVSLDGDALRRCSLGEDRPLGEDQALGEGEARGEGAILLLFTIRDTGIGIAKSQQVQIFRAFEQADGSVSRAYGGAGLGLSISTRLVEMMGGRMWLTSELGEGSTFSFSVRLGTHSPHPEDPAPEPSGPAPARNSKTRGSSTGSPKSPASRDTESRLESEALLSAFVLQRSSSRIPIPSSAPSESLDHAEEAQLGPYGTPQAPATARRASEPTISASPLLHSEGLGRHSSPMTPTARAQPRSLALTPSRLFHAYSSGAMASASPRPLRSQGPKTRHQSGSGIPPAPRMYDMRSHLISERSVGRILDGLVHAQPGSATGSPHAPLAVPPEVGPGPGAPPGPGSWVARQGGSAARQGGDAAGGQGGGKLQQPLVEHEPHAESAPQSPDSCGGTSASEKPPGRQNAPGVRGQHLELSQAELDPPRSRPEAKERPPLAGKGKDARGEQSQGQEGPLFSKAYHGYSAGTRGSSDAGSSLAVLNESASVDEEGVADTGRTGSSAAAGTAASPAADVAGERAEAESLGEVTGGKRHSPPGASDSSSHTLPKQDWERGQQTEGQAPTGIEGAVPGGAGTGCSLNESRKASWRGALSPSGARQEERQGASRLALGSSGGPSAAQQQVDSETAVAAEAGAAAPLSLEDVYSRIVMSSLSPRGASSQDGATGGPSRVQSRALDGERGHSGSLPSTPRSLSRRVVKQQEQAPQSSGFLVPPSLPPSVHSTAPGPGPRSSAAQEGGEGSSGRHLAQWRHHEAQDAALLVPASASSFDSPASGPRGALTLAHPIAEAAAVGTGAGAAPREPGSSPGERCLLDSAWGAEVVPPEGHAASVRESLHLHLPLVRQLSGERERLRRRASMEKAKGRKRHVPVDRPASSLKASEVRSGPSTTPPKAGPSQVAPGSGPSVPRVLVVDDSLINQKVALRFLKKYGLPAEAVGDGAQALARLYPHMAPASDLSMDTGLSACELRGEVSQRGGPIPYPTCGRGSGIAEEAASGEGPRQAAPGSGSPRDADGAHGPLSIPPFDVVLLDIQMPVMDGIETVRRIRAREQASGQLHLPVIGLTAHAAAEYRERSLAAGMDDFVSKPFTVRQLLQVMQEVLSKHSHQKRIPQEAFL